MENPEQFNESNVEASWLRYLSSMSRQETWADHIIIQEVAEVINLKIHIIESDNNFRDMTLVEPSNSTIQNTSWASLYRTHRSDTLCVKEIQIKSIMERQTI